jgi:hypothetical protein
MARISDPTDRDRIRAIMGGNRVKKYNESVVRSSNPMNAQQGYGSGGLGSPVARISSWVKTIKDDARVASNKTLGGMKRNAKDKVKMSDAGVRKTVNPYQPTPKPAAGPVRKPTEITIPGGDLSSKQKTVTKASAKVKSKSSGGLGVTTGKTTGSSATRSGTGGRTTGGGRTAGGGYSNAGPSGMGASGRGTGGKK